MGNAKCLDLPTFYVCHDFSRYLYPLAKSESLFFDIPKPIQLLADWINRYVEDHIIYYNKERRIALVVEADNSIGYALCKKLIKKNYHVVVGVAKVKRGVV